MTDDGIYGVDLKIPAAYVEPRLLLEGAYEGLSIWGHGTECPLIVTSQETQSAVSLLVVGNLLKFFDHISLFFCFRY